MDRDSIDNQGRDVFLADRPLQMLKQDHAFVRQLFNRFLNTDDVQVKQEAGPRILQLLEMHTALEEASFYPYVRQIDASLVDECKGEHEQADQLIHQLKGMDAGDPQCDRLFRHLADAIIHHIEVEEHQLFPKVEQANLDLEAIGLEMQAFENNMVEMQARETERKDINRSR